MDLGGDVSTAKDAIISLAVKTKLILDSIDVWLLQQPALIDKRKRSLLPAVRERQALADALARYLAMLGLERRHKVQTLQDLLTGDSDKPATVNCNGRLMETTALTTSSAETEATPSAEPRTFARTALTHVQNDSGRCTNPLYDKQRKIKPPGRHGRYCSPPCRMDGVTRYDAKALLNKVGIVRFHELLDQA